MRRFARMVPWRSRAVAGFIEPVPALSRRAAPHSLNSAIFALVESVGGSLICPTGLANLPADRYICGGSARPEHDHAGFLFVSFDRAPRGRRARRGVCIA